MVQAAESKTDECACEMWAGGRALRWQMQAPALALGQTAADFGAPIVEIDDVMTCGGEGDVGCAL